MQSHHIPRILYILSVDLHPCSNERCSALIPSRTSHGRDERVKFVYFSLRERLRRIWGNQVIAKEIWEFSRQRSRRGEAADGDVWSGRILQGKNITDEMCISITADAAVIETFRSRYYSVHYVISDAHTPKNHVYIIFDARTSNICSFSDASTSKTHAQYLFYLTCVPFRFQVVHSGYRQAAEPPTTPPDERGRPVHVGSSATKREPDRSGQVLAARGAGLVQDRG